MSVDGKYVALAAVAGAVAGATALAMFAKPTITDDDHESTISEQSGDKDDKLVFRRVTKGQRDLRAGVTARWTKPVVISSPGLGQLAENLQKRLGCDVVAESEGPTLSLEKFKSNDPNVKFNWQRVVGRKIVFLFDTVDQERFFEQLALLQALQGFALPDEEDKNTKWKTYINAGKYSWGRASHITVVLPWYRPCQMERTSRWHLVDGKWTNGHADGQWLDVPTAQYMARLLATPGSVPPLPGPSEALDGMPLVPLWRPPLELLFVELHEEAPISHSVSDLGATIRMERFVPYFLGRFRSNSTYPGRARTFVLFPDRGAYDRYADSVMAKLKLDSDHVLYIKKTRVGDSISQEQKLFYCQADEDGQKTAFSAGDHVLIVDDFTNSGSTLFGAANLAKSMLLGDAGLTVSIFVSHLVAAYDLAVVKGFQNKLHELGPDCKFYTTNSIPKTTDILKDDPQVEVLDISDFIANLVQ